MNYHSIKQRLLSSELFKDSIWALFGNVMSKGISLVAAVLVARFLGREMYGEYGMIKNTLIYIAVFSTFGLGFTATKIVAQNKDKAPDKLRIHIRAAMMVSFCFSGVMAVLVFTFAHPLAVYLEDLAMATIFRYTAVVIIFNSIATVQIGILAGLKKFKQTAYVNIAVGCITFIFSIILALYYGLEGAVIALLITNVANCFLNHIVLRKALINFPKTHIALWDSMKEQIRFSVPIAIQESSYSITFWVSNLLLVKMANYGQLGLHSAATQWTAVILFIPSVLQNVMLSYLSESAEASSTRNQHKILKRMLFINFLATFVPFLICLAISPFIMALYGESYESLPLVLNIAMAATIIRCLIQVFIQEFIALGKTWILCGIRLGRDLLSLTLSAILILHLKENAAVLYNASFLIASAFCLLLMWTLYNKFAKPQNQ